MLKIGITSKSAKQALKWTMQQLKCQATEQGRVSRLSLVLAGSVWPVYRLNFQLLVTIVKHKNPVTVSPVRDAYHYMSAITFQTVEHFPDHQLVGFEHSRGKYIPLALVDALGINTIEYVVAGVIR